MPSIMWFRRDLRLRDNPALLEAIAAARTESDDRVVPLFVVDPMLWEPSGPIRQSYLAASLSALDESLGGSLHVRLGDPRTIVPDLVKATGATSVHIAADYGPYGHARDRNIEQVLGDRLIRTGSSSAVAPGRVTKDDGSPYRVYTPFYRAWLRHGWRTPAADIPDTVTWCSPPGGSSPPTPPQIEIDMPTAGEQAAWQRWTAFRRGALAEYAEHRDRADLAGTSAMGHHLKWGESHPRSQLAELGEEDEVYRK